MNQKKLVLIGLIFPIIVLMGLTIHKKIKVEAGTKIILDIEGYDPRDLLSGHYIIFRVNYGIKKMCSGSRYRQTKRDAYVCLREDGKNYFTYSRPRSCLNYIKGNCQGSRFKDGLDRFYIPQKDAPKLDKLVRGKKGSIEVSLSKGKPIITEMLIEGVPWKEYLESE